MATFGTRSEENLKHVHPELVQVARFVVERFDCTVLDGVRTLAEQQKNVERGVSKTMASKHLPQPTDGFAHAIDIGPYPIDWDAVQRGLNAMRAVDPGLKTAQMYAFIGYFRGVAAVMGIDLRSGADWDSDNDFSDHSFIDLVHQELRSTREQITPSGDPSP